MLNGTVEPSFWPVAAALDQQVRRRGGGAAVCVYHRGRKVADLWAGERDADGHAWASDTMAMSFSTTKGVVATALHVLADRGQLGFEDRVAKFWPEFAQAGKALDHAARRALAPRRAAPGPASFRPARAHPRLGVHDGGARRSAAAAHAGRPLRLPRLHLRLAGRRDPAASDRASRSAKRCAACVAEPLGLDGCYIGAPAEARKRAATLIRPKYGGVASLIASRRLMGALDRVYRTRRDPRSPRS